MEHQNTDEDYKYFREQLGKQRGFIVCYEVITEESARHGDTAENGVDGYHSCEPDEYDIEDGKSAVDLAVEWLGTKCLEYSGNGWWTDADGDTDMHTGDETRHSYHPYNWATDELDAITGRVKA